MVVLGQHSFLFYITGNTHRDSNHQSHWGDTLFVVQTTLLPKKKAAAVENQQQPLVEYERLAASAALSLFLPHPATMHIATQALIEMGSNIMCFWCADSSVVLLLLAHIEPRECSFTDLTRSVLRVSIVSWFCRGFPMFGSKRRPTNFAP